MFQRLLRKFQEPHRSRSVEDRSEPPAHRATLQAGRPPVDVHRNGTVKSTLSSFDHVARQAEDPQEEEQLRERSQERQSDPIGLTVVHEPDSDPSVDIIFVHGLGGTSVKTWSRNRDINLFWSGQWLPYESGFHSARVLSFGYNAHFAALGKQNVLNIADFANDLLCRMKVGIGEHGDELHIGKVPIIFVAHSMGGLVVKKACVIGQNDTQYKHLIESTRAIMFLSTPHRGTDLAELLNLFLSISVFNHSAKIYIKELERNSSTLQDINQQFKNIAPRLQLVSLYETQQTPIGRVSKAMVLEKDSSILGYPEEISQMLNADHHNVCKYTSQGDPNYVIVRNLLRWLLGHVQSRTALADGSVTTAPSTEIPSPPLGAPAVDPSVTGLPSEIVNLLGLTEPPNDDLEFFRSRRMPGSCEWVLKDDSLKSWLSPQTPTSRALWIHGVPGAGKSIMSSYIISHLKKAGAACQFFFFRYEDQSKRSVDTLLRSLALQIASEIPEYEHQLYKLAEEVGPLDKAGSRVLWQKLYLSRLFKIRRPKPLYWVIDALDECDAPHQLLALLSEISIVQMPIHMLFIGRKTQAQSMAFLRMADSLQLQTMCTDQSSEDLERYVITEMDYMRGHRDFKARISKDILDAANGNFLWVTLVLNDISQCHTEAAIEQTLREVPSGLELMYQRMESSLASTLRAGDRGLTRTILTWAACSRRPLFVEELEQALTPEHSGILELEHTAIQVCGGFVSLDIKRRVVMVHQSAREYLVKTPGLQYSIVPRSAHRDLFAKCLTFLSTSTHRARSDPLSAQPFMLYAATSWSYHLTHSAAFPDHMQLLLLAKFFQGPSVIFWIHLLASHAQLSNLIQASQSITSYMKKQSIIDNERSPMEHRLQEKELVELWATDLVKLVGKFGSNLVRHPRSIYGLVPAFCPTSSMIHRQFRSRKGSSTLSIRGFASSSWDDCLAKLPISRTSRPLKIVCNDKNFAILTSDGTVSLYHAATCENIRRIAHGERVLCFSLSDSWRKLVTYGFHTTKVWDVHFGRQLQTFRSPPSAKAQAVSFLQGEDILVSCSDDRSVRQANLDHSKISWAITEASPGGDGFNGKSYNSPRRVAFSDDGLQVAIAYRGFPLLVWGVDPPGLIGRCERLTDGTKSQHDLWTEVGPICWNPVSGHVLGLYSDGCIFKWHPIEQDKQELKTVAADIQCSPGGNVFVTSNVDGTLRIWDFHHFALIYSLSCHTPVTNLAISPNGRRVYDLRDSFCNVWEPNALIRLAETDDQASDTSSTLGGFSQASEATVEMSEPLTAFAISPQNLSYCVADETGSLRLHECGKSKSVEITRTFMPVDHATWSDDGKVLVTADLGGKLSVWAVDPQAPTEKLALSFDVRIASIQQILISHDSQYLFVAVQGFSQLWSISQKSLVTSQLSSSKVCRWVQSPGRNEALLRIEFDGIKVVRWIDLTELGSFAVDRASFDTQTLPLFSVDINPTSPSEDTSVVDRVLTTSDHSQLLFQTSEASTGRQRRRQIILISNPNLELIGSTVKPIPLPQHVDTQLEIPLGFVARDHRRPSFPHETGSEDILVFLDREFWVCSWAMNNTSASTPKRHFFLPQDWVNEECFRFATTARDGTLFIPRNGEIAVIQNGLREEWLE